MIHGSQVRAEPFDLLFVDEVVDHLGLRAGVSIEVHDVVAGRLGPVVLVPTGVEDHDVAFADLLTARHAVEHLVQRVERPWPRDRSHVDHQPRAHQVGQRDLSQVFARFAVVDWRVDVGASVHVGLDQHRALAIAMVGGDVGHLDRGELRPRRHAVAPRLCQVNDAHSAVLSGVICPKHMARISWAIRKGALSP